jgi:hypothetical protein
VAAIVTALFNKKEETAMQPHYVYGLLMIFGLATTARGQLLDGDPNFPILNEIRWDSGMKEVRNLCETRHVIQNSTDSAMIISAPMLGFAARTEVQFDRELKTIKLIQVKFEESTKSLVDSVTSYFTRTLGRQPILTVKEKSLLIVTVRMELASWRSPTGVVSLVTAKRGDSLFNASLMMGPPTNQRTKVNAK